MRALFLKDWYMAKSYCRSYLLIVVVFAAVSFVSSESLFFMAYPAIMFGILPVTLISYDERFHWPAYAGTLPLRRRDEVREKYLLSLLLIAVMGILMTALQAIAEMCIRDRDKSHNLGYCSLANMAVAFFKISFSILRRWISF